MNNSFLMESSKLLEQLVESHPSFSKLAFVGDSITSANGGYVQILEFLLAECQLRELQLVNAGQHGFMTVDVIPRLYSDVIQHNPDGVFISLGINDCRHSRRDNLPLISANDFRRNYSIIVQSFSRLNIHVVALTTTPVVEDKANSYPEWAKDVYWSSQVLKQYNEIIKEVGKAQGIPVIEIFSAFESMAEIERYFLDDGVHPNLAGHKVIALQVLKYLAADATSLTQLA